MHIKRLSAGAGMSCRIARPSDIGMNAKPKDEQEHGCERNTIHYTFPTGGLDQTVNKNAQLFDAAERQLDSYNSPFDESGSSRGGMTGYSIDIGRHTVKSLIKNTLQSNCLNYYLAKVCTQFHELLS